MWWPLSLIGSHHTPDAILRSGRTTTCPSKLSSNFSRKRCEGFSVEVVSIVWFDALIDGMMRMG